MDEEALSGRDGLGRFAAALARVVRGEGGLDAVMAALERDPALGAAGEDGLTGPKRPHGRGAVINGDLRSTAVG